MKSLNIPVDDLIIRDLDDGCHHVNALIWFYALHFTLLYIQLECVILWLYKLAAILCIWDLENSAFNTLFKGEARNNYDHWIRDFTTKLRITKVRTRKLSTEYWEFQKLRKYFHRIFFSRWLQVFQNPESPNMRNP